MLSNSSFLQNLFTASFGLDRKLINFSLKYSHRRNVIFLLPKNWFFFERLLLAFDKFHPLPREVA
jgi:hypothetical protein